MGNSRYLRKKHPRPRERPGKRALMACTRCRRLRKKCEGGPPQCNRCNSANHFCYFVSVAGEQSARHSSPQNPIVPEADRQLECVDTTLAINDSVEGPSNPTAFGPTSSVQLENPPHMDAYGLPYPAEIGQYNLPSVPYNVQASYNEPPPWAHAHRAAPASGIPNTRYEAGNFTARCGYCHSMDFCYHDTLPRHRDGDEDAPEDGTPRGD